MVPSGVLAEELVLFLNKKKKGKHKGCSGEWKTKVFLINFIMMHYQQ
jgi:hypothetical protein